VSGLYGLVFGQNPAAAALLVMCGFTKPLPEMRFRDAWLEQHGDEPLIHVYTRIGGPNRVVYEASWEHVRAMPAYVRDEDDRFDTTYASIWYRIDWAVLEDRAVTEDDFAAARNIVIAAATEPIDTATMWEEGLEAIRRAHEQ